MKSWEANLFVSIFIIWSGKLHPKCNTLSNGMVNMVCAMTLLYNLALLISPPFSLKLSKSRCRVASDLSGCLPLTERGVLRSALMM